MKKAKKKVKKAAKKVAKKRQSTGKFRVYVTESERGWGVTSDIVSFKTKKAAEKYVDEINSANTDPTAPDWYMQAELLDGE